MCKIKIISIYGIGWVSNKITENTFPILKFHHVFKHVLSSWMFWKDRLKVWRCKTNLHWVGLVHVVRMSGTVGCLPPNAQCPHKHGKNNWKKKTSQIPRMPLEGGCSLAGKMSYFLKKIKPDHLIGASPRTAFAELNFSMIQSLAHPETQHCIFCKCGIEDAVYITQGLLCRLMGCIYFWLNAGILQLLLSTSHFESHI